MTVNKATRKDVAQRAGVSVATVSYVVNNGPRPVAEETRQRVQQAIQELGYRPHAIARSLRKGSTDTIGLLVPSLVSPFHGNLVNAVEENLARFGRGLVLASSHEDYAREAHMLDVLSGQAIDGLLYVPMSHSNGNVVSALIARGIPLVFLDRFITGVSADVVATDNVEAARRCTEYLIRQGCRRIICLSFSDGASAAVDRVHGFREVLKQHGLEAGEHQVVVIKYAVGETVEDHLPPYFQTYGFPDGILITADLFMVPTLKLLRTHGARVPQDVHITGGFFSTPMAELIEPPLPIVSQDYTSLARTAVEFLIERIEGNDVPPRTELIPAQFPPEFD
jgi:DNA-binding LacI/PurR family transcriptional regulator